MYSLRLGSRGRLACDAYRTGRLVRLLPVLSMLYLQRYLYLHYIRTRDEWLWVNVYNNNYSVLIDVIQYLVFVSGTTDADTYHRCGHGTCCTSLDIVLTRLTEMQSPDGVYELRP